MKLGVSFNAFDCTEFLEKNIENTRKFADYISVVYQDVSYFGQKNEHVNEIKSSKADDIVLFMNEYKFPVIYSKLKSIDAHRNEVKKRQLGLELSRKNGCTHHLSMDLDEFYFAEEVNLLKDEIERYDTTACSIQEYHCKPIYRKKQLADYYVSFISNVKCDYELHANYFLLVDPSRRIKSDSCKLLDLKMHHYTTIRNGREGLLLKYRNSSAKDNIKGIEGMVQNILNFDITKSEEYEVCEDYFNLKDI